MLALQANTHHLGQTSKIKHGFGARAGIALRIAIFPRVRSASETEAARARILEVRRRDVAPRLAIQERRGYGGGAAHLSEMRRAGRLMWRWDRARPDGSS